MTRTTLLIFLIINLFAEAPAQQKPHYWDDIQTIKSYDKMYAPPANAILFVGSSSIRKWDDLERTFARYVAINRGIGGAFTNDITFYANDVIFPYNPRQIVLYVGENDFTDQTVTPDSVFNRTKQLLIVIRAKLPDIPIIYISIKPSPSRIKNIKRVAAANALIKQYISKEHNMVFIDVFHLMLNRKGAPKSEIFLSDSLHMNHEGYKIWTKAITPYLLKKKE
jgi:lysophospholipase L1-like esterase